MATQAAPHPITDEQDPGEFDRLRRFILYHLGGFTLGLVRVNDPRQRDGVIASLTDALAADGARLIRVDVANRHPANLRDAIFGEPAAQAALKNDPQHTALAVVGLEHLVEAEARQAGRPPFAAALNLERDALPQAIPVPLILFLTDHAMDRLDLAAPDFFDWYSGIFRLRPAGAPALETAMPQTKQAAEPPPSYSTALSPDTLSARLELLEERRMELERAGPEARPRLAQVLQEIGDLYAGLPEYKEWQNAVLPLRRAAEILHETGQKAQEAAVLERFGNVCYWINDWQQAIRRCETALSLYREICEASRSEAERTAARLGEANCISRLGDVHVQLDEYPQARQRYEAALPIYREIGDRLGEANTLTAFGVVSLAEKDYGIARDWFEQALRIYREIGDRHWQTYVAPRLAIALLALNEVEQAVQVLEKGAQLAQAIEGQPNLGVIQQLLDQIRNQSSAS